MAARNEELLSRIASLQARLRQEEVSLEPASTIEQVHPGKDVIDRVPGLFNACFMKFPQAILTVVDTFGTSNVAATAFSPSPSPPDFSLSDLTGDSGGFGSLPNDGCDGQHLPPWNDVDNSFDSESQAIISIEPQSLTQSDTGSISTPSVQSGLACEVYNQSIAREPENIPCAAPVYASQDMECPDEAYPSYSSDMSSLVSTVYENPYATNFQVMQLLEVARQKEHAARLLQEAAQCREYTVHSLLAEQGVSNTQGYPYSSGAVSTALSCTYSLNSETWNSYLPTYQGSILDLSEPVSTM